MVGIRIQHLKVHGEDQEDINYLRCKFIRCEE